MNAIPIPINEPRRQFMQVSFRVGGSGDDRRVALFGYTLCAGLNSARVVFAGGL